MIGDYAEQQHKDRLNRNRADRFAGALSEYSTQCSLAIMASGHHNDERSAELFRADARAALHLYPELLALVEPREPEGVQAVTTLVERVGQWTGR